jgi:hypothetical protein
VTLLVLDHARKERLDGPEVRQRVHVERLHDFGWKQKQKKLLNYYENIKKLLLFWFIISSNVIVVYTLYIFSVYLTIIRNFIIMKFWW